LQGAHATEHAGSTMPGTSSLPSQVSIHAHSDTDGQRFYSLLGLYIPIYCIPRRPLNRNEQVRYVGQKQWTASPITQEGGEWAVSMQPGEFNLLCIKIGPNQSLSKGKGRRDQSVGKVSSRSSFQESSNSEISRSLRSPNA
jgi:hypothetical protein